jgi:hypothetical protein
VNPQIIDWKLLRGSIIVLVLSVSISASLVYAANYFQQQMLREFNMANAAFRSISTRYLTVDEEEKLVRSYLPRFVQLYQSGIIGNEQRLNWVEVLRATGDEYKIPALSYQIESQQVYTPGYPLNLGRYSLYSSKMLLNMQLLHEGDLFRIFEKLDENAKGSFTLTSCSVNQSVQSITDSPNAGNITVRCELQWFTIRLADGTQIQV